ncbi:hypothetical protein L208DRAFT_1383678 [Tricholoma matsutake]|nr:hypothetical protein L208DRAFT_1383678 [Tricholoma matsutake 945]
MRQSQTSDTVLLSQVHDQVESLFGQRPCLWQIRVVQAILKNDKDIVSVSAMGSGKTLTFWMPLLFIPDGIQIVVTPLNILGKQNVDILAKVGINAVSVTAEMATAATFQVTVVTNIETLSKPDGGFEKLFQNKDFMSKVISIVWDQANKLC